jgi:shikimate dehydrogenase
LSENLDSFVIDFFKNGGHGLNVTLPHKIDCLRLAGHIPHHIRLIGAANILGYIKDEEKITVDSTDGEGLVQDLEQDLEYKFKLRNSNVLILGAGGAALSIIPNIIWKRAPNIILDNRSQEKIQLLIDRFDQHTYLFGIKDRSRGGTGNFPPHNVVHIDNFEGNIDLVINATSAGFSGSFEWHRDLNVNCKMDEMTVFYDLSYSNSEEQTPFLKWASQYSDNCYDGFGMLVNQAALSFYYWTGRWPDTKIIKSDLLDD